MESRSGAEAPVRFLPLKDLKAKNFPAKTDAFECIFSMFYAFFGDSGALFRHGRRIGMKARSEIEIVAQEHRSVTLFSIVRVSELIIGNVEERIFR
jgi:hypothetical protein